jgi:hypothetical protein
MRLICDCGKEVKGYDDFNFNGDKIWVCESCGKKFICDEVKD